MEFRRRTLSSVLDKDDCEIYVPNPNETHIAINEEDTFCDYAEYVYNGYFNLCNYILFGFLNLICPCCKIRRTTVTTTVNQ